MAIKMWKIVAYLVTNSIGLSDWKLVDVYFLLPCRNVTTNVVAILCQSSGELFGPWAFCLSFKQIANC